MAEPIDQRAQRHDPANKHTHDSNDKPVRPSGPENQKDPPPDWSKTDEEGDESFPASDPPANY